MPQSQCRCSNQWTDCPYEKLCEDGGSEIEKLRAKAKADLADLGPTPADGGALLCALGQELEKLTGIVDYAFSQALPEQGAKVVLNQALCPLYDRTLADGDKTLTGAFVESFAKRLNAVLLTSNIAMTCWRKGTNGVELKRGQAGCKDPTGEVLRLLKIVKELLFIGLRAAGLKVVAIIASANASHASFDLAGKKHYVAHQGKGLYEGVRIFLTPHPKYASPTCVNNDAVAMRLGALGKDQLAVTSRVLLGWAEMATALNLLVAGGDEAQAESCEEIYEALRQDENSPAVAREWQHRLTNTTSPEVAAKLKEAIRKNSQAGGEPRTRALAVAVVGAVGVAVAIALVVAAAHPSDLIWRMQASRAR